MDSRGLAYSAVTRFSGEQETKDQLQGSTEYGSQFFSAPWGSLRRLLTIIRTCTASTTEINT